jgi:hypothetical protein|tara:strand:- start:2066 stop:2818 length:753 start_codon:yes stop_codon:yes gene_type:complete
MSKLIEFSAHPDLYKVKHIQPRPTKYFLPDWYKKIDEHNVNRPNIKGCMPFLDGISAGYVIPLPIDVKIDFMRYNERIKKHDFFCKFGPNDHRGTKDYCHSLNINFGEVEAHGIGQVGGEDSFVSKKNNNLPILKILNPWTIKTPPGYSCLFMSPVLNENDHFHAISAIVDTDTFHDKINFPVIMNGDKYDKFDKVFGAGLPLVQVIPFKREAWKHSVNEHKVDWHFLNSYFTKILNRYKTFSWNKKKWM